MTALHFLLAISAYAGDAQEQLREKWRHAKSGDVIGELEAEGYIYKYEIMRDTDDVNNENIKYTPENQKYVASAIFTLNAVFSN